MPSPTMPVAAYATALRGKRSRRATRAGPVLLPVGGTAPPPGRSCVLDIEGGSLAPVVCCGRGRWHGGTGPDRGRTVRTSRRRHERVFQAAEAVAHIVNDFRRQPPRRPCRTADPLWS